MKQLILFVIIFSLSTNLFSQPNNPEMLPPKEKLSKYLNLTAEQEKKINDLNYNLRKSEIDLKSKINKNRLELKKLIDDGNIDEKKILQLVDDNSKLQAEIKNMKMKKWLDIYKILDKEQQQKWIKGFQKITEPGFMKNKMKERMKDRIYEFRHNKMR
ncbi:MAG: Spy/CpxP family protein refolding chaperone [Stygiobacter sp.]